MSTDINIERATVEYFRAYSGWFWTWADKGEVIEHSDRRTLCFRSFLDGLLPKLAENGLPRLSSVLLILAAIQDRSAGDWTVEGLFKRELETLYAISAVARKRGSREQISQKIGQAVDFLNMVRSLRDEYKDMKKAALLIGTVLPTEQCALPPALAVQIVAGFVSGRWDRRIVYERPEITPAVVLRDLEELAGAAARFPHTAALETALRTGLLHVPDPADIQPPRPDTGDLLDELEEDNRTYGMARLARRLMAAIHIPLHTRGSSDQSYGGVSDITNRGDFDRLLLSELAYDDSTLLARLANNEALYLRREEPPQDLIERRIVLIDTTIKMWGVPRVFAISAALACTINEREGLAIGAFALEASTYESIDLRSKSGLIDALSLLDPAMHCGEALRAWVREQKTSAQEEVIFITDERHLRSTVFQACLSEAREHLDYLITVNRAGNLQFFQFSGGRRKLLNQAVLNLEETLFSTRKVDTPEVKGSGRKPAFYRSEPSPLLFPAPGGKLRKGTTFARRGLGVLSILPNGRVLRWGRYAGGAASEVLARIEEGSYFFGCDSQNQFFVAVNNPGNSLLKLYVYQCRERKTQVVDFTYLAKSWSHICFREHRFIVTAAAGQEQELGDVVFDCQTMEDIGGQYTREEVRRMVHTGSNLRTDMETGELKGIVNQGYSIVKKVSSVYIDDNGRLCVGKRRLEPEIDDNSLRLVWTDLPEYPKRGILPAVRASEAELYDPLNRTEFFRRFVWADGSELLSDTRGMLHLISSDPGVPQVSIVMIIGSPTSAWIENRGCFGSGVFIPAGSNHLDFNAYQASIQAFIDVISKKCS